VNKLAESLAKLKKFDLVNGVKKKYSKERLLEVAKLQIYTKIA
jgi:hypothetical protein